MDIAERAAESHAHDASGTSRVLAVWVVLGGGLVALPVGPAALSLVREQLHIGCSMGQPLSEGAGTWTCSDGIGYLGVAVTFGGMWLLVVLLGSLTAGAVRNGRAARIILVVLAGASAAWILGWTWYGSNVLVDDRYALMTGARNWRIVVGPAAIVIAASMAIAAVSLLLGGRPSRIGCAAAALGLLIATALHPGLGISTLSTAGLLTAAAVVRIPPPTPAISPPRTKR